MRVVHIREHHTIYIGRPSIYGNPFSHKAGTLAKFRVNTREEAISNFEQYARTNDSLLKAIRELKETDVLGCFCKPLSCHGDVIVKIWKERRGSLAR